MIGKTLKHPFFGNFPTAIDLFTRNPQFGTVVSRVNRIADKISTGTSTLPFTSTKTSSLDIANDFRGAAFEGFGEIFIKLMGVIPQIGIDKYEPLTGVGDDYGVDGKGIGRNGKLLTVQFKFRSEYDTVLHGNKDHLHNFVNASLEMGVDINDNDNMVIITTADEVFYKDMTAEWKEKVRYISPNNSWGCYRDRKYAPQNPTNLFSLKSLLDDNPIFWNAASDLVNGIVSTTHDPEGSGLVRL